MKIHCNYTGIKGFVTAYNHAVRCAYMITETALKRVKILDHWKKYGLRSAIDAFDISERTLCHVKHRMSNIGNLINQMFFLQR